MASEIDRLLSEIRDLTERLVMAKDELRRQADRLRRLQLEVTEAALNEAPQPTKES